jgi:lysophospholipase L1-like esterase
VDSVLENVRLQRPGRRAARVAARGAYGGGALGSLGALGYAVIRAEAALARRSIGEPTEVPPDPTGVYGQYLGRSTRLVMLGDSSATGLGCDVPAQTPGALLAGGVARELRRRVRLDVYAVVGAQSADLDTQIARALAAGNVDLAVIMVGANDVTHTVMPGDAVRHLGRAVETLRDSGAKVVVGTCPDLGTVKPLLQPLRTVAAVWSRKMAAAQAVAVAENDGVAVTLGSLLSKEFHQHAHLWSHDRFHPSAQGYARVADVILPNLLELLGVELPEAEVSSVQDANLAATMASREPGLVVETVEGAEGVAAVGPGRLVRLVRRLPLVGRGAPDERSDEPVEQDADGPDWPAVEEASTPR